MRLDKRKFASYGWFYGVPVYLREDGDGIELAGRNIVFDWLVLHVCPHLHSVVSYFYEMIHGEPMEGFMIKITGDIEQ